MRPTSAVAVAVALLVSSPLIAGESYLLEKNSSDTLTPPTATFEYSRRFAVMSVAISADGREVAAAARTAPDGLKSWRLSDGRAGRMPKVSGVATRIAYANGSPRVAVAISTDALSGREGMIELADLSTGRTGPSLRGAEDVRAIAFSPDDQIILAALPEGVRAWDLREGSSRDLLRLRGGADTVSFSAADEAYVSAEGGAMIYRVRIPGGEILEQWKGKRADGPIAVSAGGRLLAATTQDGVVKLHDLIEGGKARPIDVGGPVTSLDWAAGGRWLAVGTKAGEVRIYEVPETDSLPMGFLETPRLEGRGGGIIGSWAGEPDRSAGRVDRDERNDRGIDRRRDDDEVRLDLEMGRDTGRLGDGPSRRDSGRSGRGLPPPTFNAPLEIEVRPKVIVLDQMGGDPRNARALEASLTKNGKRLKRCWRTAQRAGDQVLGTVVFDLGITPNGEGVGIEPPVEDTIGSAKLVECLEGRLREALFGPGLGSMDVRLQLDFVEAG